MRNLLIFLMFLVTLSYNALADQRCCIPEQKPEPTPKVVYKTRWKTKVVEKKVPVTKHVPVQREPEESVTLPQFDLFDEPSSAGFPGMPHRQTWYGIVFKGFIQVDKCAQNRCYFRLTSDDGAVFKIDGNVVINNDGLHPPKEKTGNIKLKKGWHKFRIDWYQGPHTQIALALEVSTDGGYTYEVVEYTDLKFVQ